MALVLKDRVQETTTTSGTGTLTLSGAVSGFQTFSTAIGNGNTTYYTIFDNTAYVWEVGIGTVGAGTLARTTVLSNSSGTTTAINLAGNTAFVFVTYPAEKSINYDADGVATIGSTLGYADTGIIASFASTVAGYNQVILQNKSTATNASTNFNVSNDAGTSGSNYAELGINSSTFTGTGSFNIAGASYVASASTDLTLGTYGAYSIHFVTNSSTTDAMTIFNNGGISLGGFTNPGIGNMAASKFVPGYAAVTSAAGTTVLTASSNYYQNLLGTTTQTFQLPDATLLLEGTTFIFDNDSTGNLSVVDNASGAIETVPGGAASFVYLADNATVAGTWRRHAFLPASYDFNATTANFGNATITNAVWNGTTIGTAYGGTGLTSFSAANYALYSTSSSALTAGTLPVAAGGSGATTFTANGVLYGSGTSPIAATAAGTTGQVLLANTGGAPTWGAIPTTAAVTSFQTSLDGLTPSTATTGVVTLAGTLGVSSGGTGQTTYTDGQLLIGNTTGNTLTKATLTQGTGITITNGTGSISIANAGVTSFTSSSGLSTNTSATGAVSVTNTAPMVYPGAGIPNSTGTAWGTSYTTSGSGTVVALTTSPSFTTPVLGTPSSGTLTNCTGLPLTTGITGTLGIANGGTGQTTATAAFDALNPMTTVGDIIYEASGPTATRLPIGTTGQVLTVSGGIPSWSTPSSSGLTVGTTSITSGTNGYILYNNSGTLGNLNVSGSGNVVLATSPTISGVTLSDGYTEEVFSIPTSTTPAISPTNGSIQTWTLTGTSTPTAGTWAAGQSLTLMIDDGTSAYTISWASIGVNWVGGLAPSLAATGYTVIELWKVGTQIYGALVGNVA